MDCGQFQERLADLLEPGRGPADAAGHVAGCAPCARSLRRARLVRDVLVGAPRVGAPASLDAAVLDGRRGPAARGSFLRAAAAAALLLAGVLGSALLRGGGRGYEPLDLTVVIEKPGGLAAQDLVLEEMFGPEAAIVFAEGGPGGRRPER